MESFDDFLVAARAQADAQRLLLVFTQIDDEKEGSPARHGGFLTPKMCVDKTPDEIISFTSLVAEAGNTGQEWSILFAASLAGTNGLVPTSEDANKPLDAMINGINIGMVHNYLAFNRDGEILALNPQE